MHFDKKFILFLVILGVFLEFSCNLRAHIIEISSLNEVQTKITTLNVKPENVAVVLDFHGVITDQEDHDPPLTLRQESRELLNFLKTQGSPYVLATAWRDFEEVIKDGIIALDLAGDFEVKEGGSQPISTNKITGSRNGKVVALRYKNNTIEPWHRQKAFSLDVIYPESTFTHILVVDDSLGNLKTFEADLPKTKLAGTDLTLFHFKPLSNE